MDPVDWHKVRSVIMIASMRTISLASDVKQMEEIPGILEYSGYVFGAATALFGPWISFKDYMALRSFENQWVTFVHFFSSFSYSILLYWMYDVFLKIEFLVDRRQCQVLFDLLFLPVRFELLGAVDTHRACRKVRIFSCFQIYFVSPYYVKWKRKRKNTFSSRNFVPDGFLPTEMLSRFDRPIIS